MLISVIIPAFNEAAYLGETLNSLNRAAALLQLELNLCAEVIVVDNASNDATADVARTNNATVIGEPVHNVARVRNAGARISRGEVLVFVDADTLVPEKLLLRIAATVSDPSCSGGAVDTDYRPKKLTAKVYLQFWRLVGRLAGVAQGATQFCRREAFDAVGGFDESLFMGEDVDFYRRLKKTAKLQGSSVVLIDDLKVVPSTRRFDQWRLWRTFIWTNPLFILFFQRRENSWHGWYRTVPR